MTCVYYYVAVALLTLGAGRVDAQQSVATTSEVSDTDANALLARPVSLHVKNATLRQAVNELMDNAKVVIAYRKELADATERSVTLSVDQQPMGVVLSRILEGTKFRVIVTGPNALALKWTETRQSAAVKGDIRGTVTDATSKRPIPSATVSLEGTKIVTYSGEDGAFRLTGIPAGTYRLVIRRVGYQARTLPVVMKDDSTASVIIALVPAVTLLNDVVTTATGDRKRYEVGNAVGTIHADSIVSTTLIRNVSDLLQARLPGVVVTNTDGAVGAPSKIRLRGVNSVSLNNDPIIILDGVRLNAQSTAASLQTNVGSTQMLRQAVVLGGNSTPPLAPSRLDDIDPNTIESIDVLRGPSASSLYGTDAANGVIVIKTKKGRVGTWRATLSGDAGVSSVPGTMPEMWWGWGVNSSNGQYTSTCNLVLGAITVAGAGCVQDSVTQFNPQNYAAMRTLGTGTNQSVSGSVSGGTESLQQFFSARASSLVGMARMADAQKRLIARIWNSPVPSWMIHPNTEQDVDASSRTTAVVGRAMDVSLSTTGIYRNVLNGGSGVQRVSGVGFGASPADTLGYIPSESQRTRVSSTEQRGTAALTANYRPMAWLALNGVGGGDFGLRSDQANLRAQDCSLAYSLANDQTNCPSSHVTSRGQTFMTTANIGGHLSFSPRSWLNLQTAIGEQYSHTSFYSLQVGNSDPSNCRLAFGTTLLSPAPVCTNNNNQKYAVTESRDEAATAGVYAEQTVGLFGLFATIGVRQDIASAFGGQVTKSPPSYPKFNLSYPLSDQPFFPKQPYISSLRLRFAYGQSGNQASRTAVLNNYSLGQSTLPGTTSATPYILVNQLGNSSLRPEKGTEWEGGFDVSFLENERLHAEVTLYRKFTRDAITPVTLAPSYGADNLSQYVNLGNVANRGLEVSLTAKVLDTRLATWDVTVNGAKNTNKLVHKAPSLVANGPLSTQFREGYPLFGYWGAPVESYGDQNGDGILEVNEIRFGAQRFMGAPYPKGEITYGSSVALWNGTLRFSANLQQILSQTTPLLVGSGGYYYPRAAVDRTAPLAQQAAYLQAVVNNNMYLGESSTLRLNELSATYSLPRLLARRLRAQSASVTVAGRNLALWSSYAGKDPNVDTSGLFGEATQDNALGTPQPRMWTFRFNLEI